MAREKQTRRMIAMALAAAVTMSSVPVVAFAEGTETPPAPEQPGEGETSSVDETFTIKISTVPGEKTDETVVVEEEPVIEGDADKSDGNWDYTETTEKTTLSVEAKAGEIVVGPSENPEHETDLDYVSSDAEPDGTNDLIHVIENGSTPAEIQPGEEPGYTLIGVENTSKFFPALHFGTKPLTNDQKEALHGDNAFIHSESYTSTYVGWLPEDYRNQIEKKEDGTYYTDDEGFILDKEGGNRIYKEEKYVVGPDNQKYYLHRYDAMANQLKAEGWYQDGEWIKDLNGNSIYQVVYSGPNQFALIDNATGEKITAYCADQATPTENGYNYEMVNIEEADYYTDEQAAMIRAIAQAGYWGTSNDAIVVDNGDGTTTTTYETGSLAAMKEMLSNAYQKDKDGNVVIDEETGEPIRLFNDTEIEGSLTDGVALTATQMAIWTFSNKMEGVEFINAHYTKGGVDATEATHNPDKLYEVLASNVPKEKEDEVKMLFKLYEYLINLEPITYTEDPTTANTIINAENFLDPKKGLEFTVLDKVESHVIVQEDGTEIDVNKDDRTDNDAYNTKLTFAIVVGAEENNGDDLVVQVLDEKGNILGTGRYAGALKEGEVQLTPDPNTGECSMNIVLMEGQGQSISLEFNGFQNLQQGAYLLEAGVNRDESQTLVTMAGGKRAVNVSQKIEFSFQMDEDKVVVSEKHSTGGRKVPPTPPTDIPDEEPPLTDIPDEEPPLSGTPDEEEGMVLGAEDVAEDDGMVAGAEDELIAATGDNQHAVAGFGGMLAALAGMFMLRKKREN